MKYFKVIILFIVGVVLFSCPVDARRIHTSSTIEVISNRSSALPSKLVIAVFDVHGTLLEPTWKQEYGDTYRACTGRDDVEEWIDLNAWSKSTTEILNLIAEVSGKTIEDVEEIYASFYEHYRADNLAEAKPYTLDILRSLNEQNIPIIIITGSSKDVILRQLDEAGLLQYINIENVISQGDLENNLGREIDRREVFRFLQNRLSDYTFAYFDDWNRGMQQIITEGGIVFGLPQGEFESGEWFKNRNLHIASGANYILNGWSGFQDVVNILTANESLAVDIEQIEVGQDLIEEFTQELSIAQDRVVNIEVFVAANRGRDFTVYTRLMGAATYAKADATFPYFPEFQEGDVIVDAGSGTGELAELMALEFRGVRVIELDISHELQERASENQTLTELVYGDAQEINFPPGSIKLKCYFTVGHEIESFGGSMEIALSNTFVELKPGGRIIVRDFVIPSRTEPLYMKLDSTDGLNALPEGLSSDGIDYSTLSTRALFDRFYQEFGDGEAFEYESVMIDGEEYIKIAPEWAYEFYMRKDYTANWRNEIKEKYGYWSLEEAENTLIGLGYENIRAVPEYNDWIIGNRLRGQIGLYEINEDGLLYEVELSPTHMIVVADKPLIDSEVGGQIGTEGAIDVINYQNLFDSITIDSERGIVRIDDNEFLVDMDSVKISSKHVVFELKDREGYVLKIVRSDTRSAHNVFKSMYQIVERQDILDEFGIPYLKVAEFDTAGPPYRYVVQEAALEGSISAADLILNGELSEVDILQIAEIVNRFEKSKQYQLNMNPYAWYRVKNDDGTTQMVYFSGIVYLYDERWEFRYIGLMQWIDKKYLEGAEDYRAVVPSINEYREFYSYDWLDSSSDPIRVWKKYLDKAVWPIERILKIDSNEDN
ncbi:MAG: methyltransferase domain-containing protein [Candidatus Saelkia tenebricola]|nr:methyltransferase domain-containing protein [Candidatus Saelkia tenebricola]